MSKVSDQLPKPPRPEPAHDNLPYWEALRTHMLVIQSCGKCRKLRHYPRPVCDVCYSMECRWTEVSGRGTVHSWTVSHHAFHPGFKKDLPYVTLTVDLEEGVRLLAPLVDADASDLCIGRAVVVDYHDVDDTLTLPCFRLA